MEIPIEVVNNYILTVPDAQYETLVEKVKEETRYVTRDKLGVVHTFYYDEDGNLFSDKEKDGSIITQKVMSYSSGYSLKKNNPVVEKIRERVIRENPDLSEEEREHHVEALCEMNDAVNRLIAGGIPKDLAMKIVVKVMEEDVDDDNTDEFIKKIIEEEVESNSDSSTSAVVNEVVENE